jgi:hypothetical protein
MSIFTQQIREAIRAQEKTTILLKEGKIKKQEAAHRIANDAQVILFAVNAIEHQKRKHRNEER